MSKPPVIKPNFFYAVVSVTILLTMLGLFGLLLMQGRHIVDVYKEKIELIVEVKDETTFGGLDTLKQFLGRQYFTKINSIRFLSKEEGAAIMQKEFGQEFLKLDMPNPLYDVLIFNVKAQFMHPDSLASVRKAIMVMPSVSDVFYQQDVTTAITSNLNKISIGLLIAGFIFIVIAVVLILNTIRLSLYANRFIIKNMELVGATWDFISRPFLIRSFWHGLLSSFIASLVISGLLALIIKQVPELMLSINFHAVGLLFGILTLLGIFISVLSTYYVVRKYLKMRIDDLY
jgi:cell division transport system permease protein